MRKNSLIILTIICGVLFSSYLFSPTEVAAGNKRNTWGEWQYSSWSKCEAVEACSNQGKKTRTKTRTCVEKHGYGPDECQIEKKRVCKKYSHNKKDCKEWGYEYQPETQTKTESESCTLKKPVSCPSPSPAPSPSPGPSPSPQPSPDPTPQPTPDSSPTPDDGQSGHRSSLANDNLQCPNDQFDAVMDLKQDGNGVKDVKVRFTFNGETKEATTNEHGRAKVQFNRAEGSVTAEADGFPTQSMYLVALDCGEPVGRGGMILGEAEALANTGSLPQLAVLWQSLSLIGAGLSITGAATYGYQKIS